MSIADLFEGGLLLLLFVPFLVIVGAALKTAPRHKKGRYRFTNKGKAVDFEGPKE